jgi:hypothetical protein
MMSQRVVNISHEPELVEQSIRRKASLRHARLEGPPSLPAMTEYAHDTSGNGVLDDNRPPEKGPAVLGKMRERDAWQKRQNPLKGDSLGIFSPENKLRKALCGILIHPATEPIILILIIIQTVLLAIEPSIYKHSRSGRWGSPAFDYAFFVLFIIYTMELIARIIVSGFIFNPGEYSTLDRSMGIRKALVTRGKNLLVPQRQLSTRKSVHPTSPQVSVLRSFTGIQPPGDPSGDSSDQQRIRLARRAFLRHSFNRLDFVAVVSYWISFTLSLLAVEANMHLYIFRMLSCLRILRLLGLTSGTTAS